jgi:inactivated superfamily I helicase
MEKEIELEHQIKLSELRLKRVQSKVVAAHETVQTNFETLEKCYRDKLLRLNEIENAKGSTLNDSLQQVNAKLNSLVHSLSKVHKQYEEEEWEVVESVDRPSSRRASMMMPRQPQLREEPS